MGQRVTSQKNNEHLGLIWTIYTSAPPQRLKQWTFKDNLFLQFNIFTIFFVNVFNIEGKGNNLLGRYGILVEHLPARVEGTILSLSLSLLSLSVNKEVLDCVFPTDNLSSKMVSNSCCILIIYTVIHKY